MGGNGSEELKNYPPPFPAVLLFVNVHERKPRQKKKKKRKDLKKTFSTLTVNYRKIVQKKKNHAIQNYSKLAI